jgi:hypothetical protein
VANKVRPHALVHGRTVDNINVPLLVDDDGTLQTAGGGGGGSGPVTVADGADVVEGELADAKVLGDNAGTISAKLRGLNHIWNDVWDSVSHRLKVTPDLPALASTSTKQSDGTQKTQVVDGSGNVIGATANALDVNIKSGAGSGGTALADEAAFTQGTTQITPIGGLFKAAYTALTTGMAGVLRITAGGAAYANVDQVQGTNVDVNSGSKSAGTIRVVLATDQPALTNKLLVTPDSVALPANQSTNISQIAGTTADTNSGTKSAGTLRVVLATDQPALTNKLLVTPDSVALPANQSVNAAQLAGTTTDTNSGNKSAGTLRVVLATDQPALTNKLLTTPDLPTGASTAAKQPALGTAGSASVDVITIQGIASGTVVPVSVATIPSHAVTNAGVFAVQESGTQVQVDDAAFTPATSKIVMAGAEFDDASPDSVDEGDGGALRMSGRRELYVQLRDAAGNERGLNVSAAGSVGVTVASGGVASGAVASGAVASGAVASGAFASGALASGSIAAGAIAAGATSIAENEDVGSADGDRGVKVLFVRKATPANTSGNDGDYEFPQMSAGRVWTSSTIDAALPVGTNAIGKLAANSGVDIGDVDVTSVPTDPFGANADAASATGSLSAKLRGIATALGITALDLGSGTGGSRTLRWFMDTAQWIGGAGSVTSATQRTTLASDDPAVAVLGATTGTKVITDANGTIQQYLRGIVYQMITAGASFFTPVPTTSGGWSVFNATSGDGSTALTNTAQAIKASAGQLGGWYIYNPNSVAAYVPIYNVAAASVTVGTTNPLMVLTIPALSAANLELVMGIAFSNAGFSCAAATTAAGNTALTTALEANFWYK